MRVASGQWQAPFSAARSLVALGNALGSEVVLCIAWGKPHPTTELYFGHRKDVKDLNDLKDQKDQVDEVDLGEKDEIASGAP